MTEFLTEDNKKTIALAYDMHKRDEFLERIYSFINGTVDNVRQVERSLQNYEETMKLLQNGLFNGVKTKPGKLARSTETQES